MENEIWKSIPSHEGYEASNMGRVRSVDRFEEYVSRTGKVVRRRITGRVLSPGVSPNGYMRVCLGRGATRYVHRLVLLAFRGEPSDPVMQGCHRNGIRTDNRLDNLRWDTPSANALDKIAHCTMKFGEHHPNSKLTAADVVSIRTLYASGEVSMNELAEKFGVKIGSISRIIRGDAWRHQGGQTSTDNLLRGLRRRSKLTEDDVRAIRSQCRRYGDQSRLARRYGVKSSIINQIVHRRIWRHVS